MANDIIRMYISLMFLKRQNILLILFIMVMMRGNIFRYLSMMMLEILFAWKQIILHHP